MHERSSKSTGRKCRSTKTCGRSRRKATTPSISSAAASHARTSASPAREPDSLERGPVFGMSSLGSLASYDPATSSWRTSQLSLLGGWEPFSATFPRSGMTRSGTLFQLQPLVRRTGGSGFGFWPTPDASMGTGGRVSASFPTGKRPNGTKQAITLNDAVRWWPTPKASAAGPDFAKTTRSKTGISLATAAAMYPTPTVQDASNNGGPSQYERNSLPLNAVAGGALNPTWVEWLMGFPLGWTVCDASGTRSSRRSSRSSGGQSLTESGG